MEKIIGQQDEISGWKDHDEKQTYSTLYTQKLYTNGFKLQRKKEDKQTNDQDSKLRTKYSFNLKEINRNNYRHKLSDSEDLENDKKILLKYLQKENFRLYLRTQKLQTLNKSSKYQKEPIDNKQKLLEDNNKFTVCQSSFQSQAFKDLFLKGSTEQKKKKKSFFNTKLICQTKGDLGKIHYRSRQTTKFISGDYLKKQNLSLLQEIQKNTEIIESKKHKIKQFPLFFREIEERQDQLNKKREKMKSQLKVHKKMYKSQMSLNYEEHYIPLKQFLDNQIFSRKIKL